MSYKIVPTDNFSRELKRLAKKYPSLKEKIKDFSEDLLTNPKTGISLGHNCYKVRISTSDKSEVSTLTALELKQIIKELDEIKA